MTGERVNYLSVALRARAAIKTLKSLISAQQGVLLNTELQHDLAKVIAQLRGASANRVHAKLASDVEYNRFEEVQTLEEVTKSFEEKELLSRLESLLEGGCNTDDMRSAVKLFSAIERQALYHYHDPSWVPGI